MNTDNNLSKFNKKDGKKDSKYNNSMALSMRKKINKIEDIKYEIQKYQMKSDALVHDIIHEIT